MEKRIRMEGKGMKYVEKGRKKKKVEEGKLRRGGRGRGKGKHEELEEE